MKKPYRAEPLFPGSEERGDPRWAVKDGDGKWIALTCAGHDKENAELIARALNALEDA